ncbi:hypothetical protein [uncultured Methanobrevibacter sp.]|uniref:hypothetical protein n=1 Tax=uncultured Methanobrevibacter sp. TaxID=253161 RepID=UPI00260240D6|nr:hypothetical protein [uncultured Methanobrevibacter sp.]
MSDLSELIKIAKNIENQNEEIIRLLKKIAGEEAENDKLAEYKSLLNNSIDFGELYAAEDKVIEKVEVKEVENTYQIGTLLENDLDIGEVYFIDGENIFKLSIKNNERSIDNLTGDGQPNEFNLQEQIANESIKNNISLEDCTVILSKEQSQNLPETLRISVEQGAKKIYLPLYASAQLVGAPQNLMEIIKFDFYKTEEELLEKLFKT